MSKVLDYASVATEADARKAIQSKILDIWIHVWAIVDKKSKTVLLITATAQKLFICLHFPSFRAKGQRLTVTRCFFNASLQVIYIAEIRNWKPFNYNLHIHLALGRRKKEKCICHEQ